MLPDQIWTAILSFIVGYALWQLNDRKEELKQLACDLNECRVEMAHDYVTKAEQQIDVSRIMARLDLLDLKLDRIIENYRPKGDLN
jgi:archaellum component FlaC